MANSLSNQIIVNKQPMLAVIVPQLRKDGMHYEVNVNGFPRFIMSWSPLGRYDISESDPAVPYELVLAVSDLIEKRKGKRR